MMKRRFTLLLLLTFIANFAFSQDCMINGNTVGATTICVDETETLTLSVPNNANNVLTSSDNSIVQVVNQQTGEIRGVDVGIATLSYSNGAPGGCNNTATIVVTVLPNPQITALTTQVCEGSTITLNGGFDLGLPIPVPLPPVPTFEWSSLSPNATVNTTTGVVTGVNGGTTATIRLTETITSCFADIVISVLDTPMITGPTLVCADQMITLNTTAPTGGTWASLNLGIATVANTSMQSVQVTGQSAGTATITYTDPNGCMGSYVITVTETDITAAKDDICIMEMLTLTGTTAAGGNGWSVIRGNSVTTAVGGTPEEFVVTGAMAGTTTLRYTDTNGCIDTIDVTVHIPDIVGPGMSMPPFGVCVNQTLNLDGTNPQASTNAWVVTNNTGTATISNTGVVTGQTEGAVLVTFTDQFGCIAMDSVQIAAAEITSDDGFVICRDSMLQLTGSGMPATTNPWTSSNMAVATVNGTGLVSAVSPGTTTISYTNLQGCMTMQEITVNRTPVLTGGAAACGSGSITLIANNAPAVTDPWVVAPTGIVNLTVNTPSSGSSATLNATGTPGTVTITFTDVNGCTAMRMITINADATITGQSSLCENDTTTLVGSGVPAAVDPWVSSNIAVATVDDQGLVRGVSAGTATITYTDANNCPTTFGFTVHANPVLNATDDEVCRGLSIPVNANTASGTGSVNWTSDMPGIVSVDPTSGMSTNATGVLPGSALLTYRDENMCIDTIRVTVHDTAMIVGATEICVDSVEILRVSNVNVLGNTGSWTSSDNNIATVTTTSIGTPPNTVEVIGRVVGVSAGEIQLTVRDENGCIARTPLTVHDPVIAGLREICVDGTTMLSVTGGGTGTPSWSSSNTAVATVSNTGEVTGVSGGTAIITFVDGTSCPDTFMITINPLPIISGPDSVCVNSMIELIGNGTPASPTAWTITPGTGMATLANVGNDTVTLTGTVAGTVTVTYTNSNGCSRDTMIRIDPLPTITATTTMVCVSSNIQLNTTGGSGTPAATNPWVSSDTNIATVSNTGQVTGVSAGTVTITFTDSNGCQDTETVTVNPLPTITGPDSVCVNSMIDLTGSGTPANPVAWTLTPGTGSATLANEGNATVTLTGTSAGTVTLTYTDNNGCASDTTITVNANPIITSTQTIVCAGDMLTITADKGPNATNPWVSSNTAVATINDQGILTAIAGGTTDVTFTDSNSCSVMVTITVNEPMITGTPSTCFTGSINLTGVGTPNTTTPWISSKPKIATVTPDPGNPNIGRVIGLIPGTVTITFTDNQGCTATAEVEVCPYPTGDCEATDIQVGQGDHVRTPTDSSAIVAMITSCADLTTGVRFTDDNTNDDALYADQSDNGGPRRDTVVFCPQDVWHAVQVNFTSFDVANADFLTVYEGNLCAVQGGLRPIISANGSGVSSAPVGGAVSASCDPLCNPSGCLTFVFSTDGSDIKGTGWDAWVTCYPRDIRLEVNLDNFGTNCDSSTTTVSFRAPTITQGCNNDPILQNIDGDYIFEIRNAFGDLFVRRDQLASDSIPPNEVLPIGNYIATYKLMADTTKAVNAIFSVVPPSLVCNDDLNIVLGAGCGIQLAPDDFLEDPCDSFPTDVIQYKITVTLGEDKDEFSFTGASTLGTGMGATVNPIISVPMDSLERIGFDVCTGSFTATLERNFLFNGSIVAVDICNINVELRDNSAPAVLLTFNPTVFIDCTADEIKELLTFSVGDACDNNVTINSSVVLESGDDFCLDNGETNAVITYSSTDVCNNNSTPVTTRIPVRRSDIIVSPPDVVASCEDTEGETGLPGLVRGYFIGSQFTALDTLDLNTTELTRGLASQRETNAALQYACGRQESIVWEIVDFCAPRTRPTLLAPQLISYIDSVAPVLEASDATFTRVATQNQLTSELLVIDLDDFACTFDVTQLAAPNATDNCDDNPNVVLESVDLVTEDLLVRQSTGIRDSIVKAWSQPREAWTSLPCDTFRLMYLASDTCFEQVLQDTLFRFIEIRDITPPVAQCVNRINVSIDPNAGALIDFRAIDAGSNDNCGIDTAAMGIRLRGADTDFLPTLEINCEQVRADTEIEMQVTDLKGNTSICWCELSVEDRFTPIIVPPNDTTDSSCEKYKIADFIEGDITGTDLMARLDSDFGAPVISNNCEIKSSGQFLNVLQRECEFILERTFSVVNWDDLTTTATQTITIKVEPDWEVTFPANVAISCSNGQTASIPEPATETEIITRVGGCNVLALNVEEQTFTTTTDACLKILRTYTVLNVCGNTGEVYDADANLTRVVTDEITNAGQIVYTQTIIVNSTQPPSLVLETPNTDITTNNITQNCSQEKRFAVSATDCLGNSISQDNLSFTLTDAQGVEATISSTTFIDGTLSITSTVRPGTYELTAVANDNCGNTSEESVTIVFEDKNSPSIWGLDNVVTNLDEVSKTSQIWVSDVINGVSDLCDDSETIVTGIWHPSLGAAPSNCEAARNLGQSIIFDCNSIGIQTIRVYATDVSGNCDFLEVVVDIQDTDLVCNGGDIASSEMSRVAGQLMDRDGNMITDVVIMIEGDYSDTINNSLEGDYNLTVRKGGNYTITPHKDDDPINGVSTFDILLMSKHILNIQRFDSPYQYIAADVNKSGTVTVYDMLILRRLILGITKRFPNNTSWRFVELSHQFESDPNLAIANPFPEHITINNLDLDNANYDFMGVKIGDVNGSARANSLIMAEDRNRVNTFVLNAENRTVRTGNIVNVTFSAEEVATVEGYQFTLDYEGLELLSLQEGILKKDNFNTDFNGFLTVSWDGEAHANDKLFTLNFKALTDGVLGDMIAVSSRMTPAEAYSIDGELLDIDLAFFTNENAFKLLQNTPNPFNGQTQIGFTLPHAGEATLNIMDARGKVLYTLTDYYTAGEHNLNIHVDELGASGILLYQLKFAEFTDIKKMLIVN